MTKKQQEWYKYTSLTDCDTLPSEADEDSRLEAMLIAYGDDSSDRLKATVFSVAVVLGSSDQWSRFKEAWEKRTGAIPFHATDCESGWGDYRGMDRDVRNSLYRDLVTMLAKGDLFAFSAAINVKDYAEHLPEDQTREMAYYACFADVLARCAALGSITIPPQRIDLTFDQNFDRDPSTSDLYSYLGELKQWELHKYLGDRVTFADYRRESGVQVADLLARETMKHMENTMLPPRERWARISFVKIRENPRINVRFVDREELMQTALDYGSSFNETFHDEYRRWREECGIQADTLVSRLRFMRHRDSLKTNAAAVGQEHSDHADSFDSDE